MTCKPAGFWRVWYEACFDMSTFVLVIAMENL